MTNEQLRMQMLAGVITEGEYKAKLQENEEKENKESINENFVGMGAINNPFASRKKESYEDAFEHFLSERYEVKPNREQDLEEDKDPDIYEVEGMGGDFKDYLIELFDSIDLGDDYEEGPQSYTFEKIEWADEDNYDDAEMFEPAHEYIASKGQVNLKDPSSGTPLTFTTDGENIVVNFNTEDFPGLNN